MRKRTVTLDDGRAVVVREMTHGEVRTLRDQGETLPMTWPIEQQFAGNEGDLDALGHSEVRLLAEAVYELTFGPEQPRTEPAPREPRAEKE